MLFARHRFRVLCRVARDDVGKSWVPLKLQEVLSSMFPDLAEAIEKFNRGGLFKAELDGAGSVGAGQVHAVRGVLQVHAAQIAELHNVSLSDDDLNRVNAIGNEHLNAFGSMQEKVAALNLVEDYMANQYNLEIDRNAALDSRKRARDVAGISSSTTPEVAPETFTELLGTSDASKDEYFLDSEFVAIYW